MMREREIERLLRALEKQGATLIPTKSGTRVLFPDGVSTMTVHRGKSANRRRDDYLKTEVRRAGLIWPPDRKSLR